jgi:hypothetical protein
MAEEKVQKVVFSLPYREGMESLAGFVKKFEGTSKTYPDEKVFVSFSFPLDNTIEVAEKDALAAGYKVLRQNKQRSLKLGEYAKQFGIAAPGSAGGITATDKKLIAAMGELSTNFAKIAAAFTKRTGKAITPEEVQEILAV